MLNSAPGPACFRLLQKVQHCIFVRTNVRQPENLHFATLALVSSQINFWVRGRNSVLTTHHFLVLLIGWSKFPLRRDQSEALPISEKKYVISMESSDGETSWTSFNVDCFLRIFVRVVGFLLFPGIEALCAQVSIGLRSTIVRQRHLRESNFIYFTCLHEPDLQRPLISFFFCSSTNTEWRVNQAPVVQTVHNAIHWINLYLVDSPIKYWSP